LNPTVVYSDWSARARIRSPTIAALLVVVAVAVVGVPVQFRRSSNDDPLTLVAFHSAASAASSPVSFRDAAPVMVDVVVVVRVV